MTIPASVTTNTRRAPNSRASSPARSAAWFPNTKRVRGWLSNAGSDKCGSGFIEAGMATRGTDISDDYRILLASCVRGHEICVGEVIRQNNWFIRDRKSIRPQRVDGGDVGHKIV